MARIKIPQSDGTTVEVETQTMAELEMVLPLVTPTASVAPANSRPDPPPAAVDSHAEDEPDQKNDRDTITKGFKQHIKDHPFERSWGKRKAWVAETKGFGSVKTLERRMKDLSITQATFAGFLLGVQREANGSP